ncbi:6216_t:CDS:10 [Ambispora gerdemannii]|uniref:Mediator of RNA polymerase II transcription subunit 14 n=1 Tax=Ambispora gerdemannii TaxID=144530 RepID=A0A9N8V4P9_9GLOM|nr:6216_t:CDS:10 [Ambispora gerdemannii]
MAEGPQIQQQLQHEPSHEPQEWIDLRSVVADTITRSYVNLGQTNRQEFSKLYATVQFAKDAEIMRKCQEYHKSLQGEKVYKDKLVHDWGFYASWIHNSNAKNPDLHTAIDVLTSGTYQRFPTVIKQKLVRERLTDEQVKETLEKQNYELQMWLSLYEVVPPAFANHKVYDGRVMFRVENEFEISLTRCFYKQRTPQQKLKEQQEKERKIQQEVEFKRRLDDPEDLTAQSDFQAYLQEKKKDPRKVPVINDKWEVVDLKFYVHSKPDKWLAQTPMGLGQKFLDWAILRSNQILTPTTPLKEIPEKIPKNKAKEAQSYLPNYMRRQDTKPAEWWEKASTAPFLPLVTLHDFLHETCLVHQLHVMKTQLIHLQAGRWINNIQMEFDETNPSSIKIYYWRWKHFAMKGDRSVKGINSAIQNEKKALETYKKFHEKGRAPQIQDPPQPSTSDWIEITMIDDYSEESCINFHKNRLSKTNYAMETSRIKFGGVRNHQGLVYPTRRFQVKWSGFPKSKEKNSTRIIPWKFDSTNINIEYLLLHVIRTHADLVIRKFKEIVTDMLNRGNSFLEESDIEITHGRDGCVSYNYSAFRFPDYNQDIDYNAKKYWMTPVMRVRMTSDKWIDVSVDLRHGKIVFERNHKGFHNVILKSCNTDITDTPDTIVAMLCQLKNETLMEEVIAWAKQLGLPIDEELHLRRGDMQRFSSDTRFFKFFRFIPYPDYYLVAGTINCKLHYWLISIKEFEREPLTYIMDYLAIRPKRTIADITPLNLDNWRSTFNYSEEDEETHENLEMRPRKKRRLDKLQELKNASEDRCEENLNALAKAVALCRAHIAHLKLVPQLASHKLSYSIPTDDDMSTVNDHRHTTFYLTNSVPVLKLNKKELLARVPNANDNSLIIFDDICMRTVGWLLHNSLACSLVVKIRIKLDILPSINRHLFSDHANFDPVTSVLSLRYENLGTCIKDFLKDWHDIVMISILALQVHSNTLRGNEEILLKSFNFKSLVFVYAKVSLEFLNNHNSQGGKNPHQRIKDHLQKTFNFQCDINTLLTTLNRTINTLCVLEELENKQGLVGAPHIRIIPKSETLIRVIWVAGLRSRPNRRRVATSNRPASTNNMGINLEILDDGRIYVSDATVTLTKWEKNRLHKHGNLVPIPVIIPQELSQLISNSEESVKRTVIEFENGFIADHHLVAKFLPVLNSRIQQQQQ